MNIVYNDKTDLLYIRLDDKKQNEHKQEIDREWKKAIESISTMRKAHKSVLEQKLGKVKNIH